MKKHFLGFAIFGFIVGLSALLYAFLNAPQIEQIQQVENIELAPLHFPDAKDISPKQAEIIGFEVISANYDLDEKKLYAQIKMRLGENSSLPNSIDVSGEISTENKPGAIGISIKPVTIDRFQFKRISDEVSFTVVTDLATNEIKKSGNLYANFNFIYVNKHSAGNGRFYRSDPKPVLFVHGKDSIIE